MTTLTTRCCIAGGGPAGMMLGLLLARAGVDVIVLEKHADFLRDFRGDTIHPSTLEVMHELGLVDELLAPPHQEIRELTGMVGGERIRLAEFGHLPVHCPFIVLLPQWDFLDFLARHAKHHPGFALRMSTGVTDLLYEGDRVVGVRALAPDGPLEVRADLVVGADGRDSTVRAAAGLPVRTFGAPMDVLWFRLPTTAAATRQPVLGRIAAGRIFVMLDRGDYWQCGFVIAKGTVDEIRARGIASFRNEVARLAGAPPATGVLSTWDEVKLLTVRVDRLTKWFRDGVLCIGDAAHAMSPVGGVGINLAIQDAVAAANLLTTPLRQGRVGVRDLARVQRRRTWPTRVTQRIQVLVQNRIVRRVLARERPLKPPFAVRVLAPLPSLRRLTGRAIGLGVRPEHVGPVSQPLRRTA
jgi:2-polyprenyl-6-methoxyphenol hydroxylase-like FAD-dependent oxidoreductase